MSKNINLLPKKNKYVLKHEKVLKSLTTFSIFLLAFVFIVSVSLFLLQKTSSLNQLEKEKEDILVSLTKANEKTARYFFIRNRILEVSDILNKRSNLDKIIDLIQSKVPEDVSIDSLNIDKSSVGISLSSKSLYSINTFLDNISATVLNDKIFGNLTLNTLLLDKVGGFYKISMSLGFK